MANAILNQPHFQDADKAREYLEALRWPAGVVCPHCGSVGNHYKLQGKAHRPGLYKCVDCADQFTVTVGTVFERSKIALNVWLQAVHLMCASKKGISAKQLERMLGVTYKTAWFMSHRIREAMTAESGGLLGGGGSTVEVDETYWGNTHQSKIGKLVGTKQGGHQKEKIVSLVERVIPVDFHFSILMSRKAAIHFRQCLTASSYGINAYRPSCLLAKHRRTPASAIAILFTSVSSGAVTPN